MSLYCTCDAPQYTEAVNVCRRCLRPVIEARVWADAHARPATGDPPRKGMHQVIGEALEPWR